MTISRRKKKVDRILSSFETLDESNLNKVAGRIIHDRSSRSLTRKARKHSGRITPLIPSPTMKYDEIKENALEPEVFYDEWENYRDGMRSNWDKEETERKKLKKINTKKLKFKRWIKKQKLRNGKKKKK